MRLPTTKHRPSGDDVRRVALAALAAALDARNDDRQQEPKRKRGLTGMRAVAAGAVLYAAGHAAVTRSQYIRERFGSGGEEQDGTHEDVDEEYEPRDEEEASRLEALRKDKDKKLSFNPPETPHRLTAHPNDAPTDAKRVLRFLLFGEYTSRPPALEELPALCERLLQDLDRLERRGADSYLADLLRELPVYSGQERPFSASHVYTWGKFSSYEDDRYRRRHRAS